MDIKKIKNAIKEERINITEHADEELEDDEISNQDLYASRIPNSYHILHFPVSPSLRSSAFLLFEPVEKTSSL